MPPKKRASEQPVKYVRTSISLTPLVAKWAEELMKEKGYENFSAYMAELIRKDKEHHEERQIQLHQAEQVAGAYIMNDKDDAKKPKAGTA
ncbi:MAG: hypothetical protein AB1705_15360 [Verrucomicrobiota bacterium]